MACVAPQAAGVRGQVVQAQPPAAEEGPQNSQVTQPNGSATVVQAVLVGDPGPATWWGGAEDATLLTPTAAAVVVVDAAAVRPQLLCGCEGGLCQLVVVVIFVAVIGGWGIGAIVFEVTGQGGLAAAAWGLFVGLVVLPLACARAHRQGAVPAGCAVPAPLQQWCQQRWRRISAVIFVVVLVVLLLLLSLSPGVNAYPGGPCDENTWADRADGLVCGECKVLVDHFSERYNGSCDAYCQSVGRVCTGAWEECSGTCSVECSLGCDFFQSSCATPGVQLTEAVAASWCSAAGWGAGETSDAICECADLAGSKGA